MPSEPYMNEMIPAGFRADGSLTYKMTGGMYAEVFDNLQVRARSGSKGITNDH